MDASDVDAALSAHLTRQSRKWRPQVAVRAPGLGMDHHYGPADLPCHSASTGKLATTALVMQLVEQGELRLGTPVVSILEPDRLQGIFRDDRRDEVTVEQLLTHTAGANDYLTGPTTGPTIAELATSERDRRWHPEDLLDHARNNQRPIDAPGETSGSPPRTCGTCRNSTRRSSSTSASPGRCAPVSSPSSRSSGCCAGSADTTHIAIGKGFS